MCDLNRLSRNPLYNRRRLFTVLPARPSIDPEYQRLLTRWRDVSLVVADGAAAADDLALARLARQLWYAIVDRLERDVEVAS